MGLCEVLVVEASALWWPHISFLCCHALCTVPQTSALHQLAFLGNSSTHTVVHKYLTHRPPLKTHIKVNDHLGICLSDNSFPRSISLVSWLTPSPLLTSHWLENWPSHMEWKKRPKKEEDHSILVGGRFSFH